MPWHYLDFDSAEELKSFIRDREYECMNFSENLIKKYGNSVKKYQPFRKNDNILIHRNENNKLINFSIMLNNSGQLLIAAENSSYEDPPEIDFQAGIKLLGSRRLKINTIMGKSSAADIIIKTCFPDMELTRGRSSFEYYIMVLRKNEFIPAEGIDGAVFRKPEAADFKYIVPLQEYYEKEEVLPCPEMFSRQVSARNLKNTITGRTVFLTEYRGRIIAKANTNSSGFCHEQIGGVYTLPEFRNLGISTALISVLSSNILDAGKNPSLFVKKANTAAIRVYEKTGFKITGEFKIAYGHPC